MKTIAASTVITDSTLLALTKVDKILRMWYYDRYGVLLHLLLTTTEGKQKSSSQTNAECGQDEALGT